MRASFPLLVAAQLLIGCASDTFTVPSDGGAVDANIDATVDGAMTDGAPDAMPSDGGVPVLAESLKSGLYLWLRADDPGITLDAGRVLVWPDRSGSGADGTVAPPCDSPTIDPAPRGSFGLHPVSFDGGLNGLRLSSCFQDFSQGVTAFIVAQVHPLAASVPFLELTANGTAFDGNSLVVLRRGSPETNFEYVVGDLTGATTTLVAPSFADNNAWHVFELNQAAGTQGAVSKATLRRDGAGAVTGTPRLPTAFARARCWVGYEAVFGAARSLRGEIAELLLYGRDLSIGDRALVLAYLKSKWSTP